MCSLHVCPLQQVQPMIFYLEGVALMAIAIVYFNYPMLPKLSKIWQFWFASTLLCLLSWAGIVMVIVFNFKNAFSKNDEEGQG